MIELGFSSLKKAKGDLCAVFSYQVGDCREDRARLLSHVHSKRIRDSGHNLEQGKFQLDIRKSFFLQWGYLDIVTGPQRGSLIALLCYAQNFTGQAQSSMT